MAKSDPNKSVAAPEAVPAAEAKAAGAPAKRSAMKLPPGVEPGAPRGPQPPRNWNHGASGKPQRDFARRAGKSRKVH